MKHDIIRVSRINGIKKFDREGRFLNGHAIGSYTEWLGSDEDDYRNTLTGRMLMLLESRPLIGIEIYQKAIEQVIGKYFRDYVGNEKSFIPAFLLNDVLRMWRTFCVNYEFYRKIGDSRDKIKNLKLKFSRMLTCYSGVIYLLSVYAKNHTVEPLDVHSMIAMSPTERLEAIANDDFWLRSNPKIAEVIHTALTAYSQFLEITHEEVKRAVKKYRADEEGWRNRSYAFGEHLSKVIDLLGRT